MHAPFPIAIIDSVARWDEDVFRAVNAFARENRGSEFDYLMRAASEWGSGYTVVLVAAAVGLASRTSASLHARMRRIIVAEILVAFVVRWLKNSIGRKRPRGALAASFAGGSLVPIFDLKATVASMPSGHAATIWCLAVLLIAFSNALPTRWRWFFGGWAVVIASVGSYARIYAGVHYPLDVIAGAALGVAIALLVLWGLNRLGRRIAEEHPRREPVA